MIPVVMEQLLAKGEALKGIRILDMTEDFLGPWAASLLGQLGAEVIHVEHPGTGDHKTRVIAPRGNYPRHLSPAMMCVNTNKYFVGIDMEKTEGADLIEKLALASDIVMESFDPALQARRGIGYLELREVKPEMIYLSLRGLGDWGPLSSASDCSDGCAQAMTGFSEITGFADGPPLKTSARMSDFLGGTLGAFYSLLALYHRKRTGKGQYIDLSRAEVLMRAMDWTWIYGSLEGRVRGRFGNRDMAVVPSCIVRAKDGFLVLAGFSKEEFDGLCTAMHRNDLKEYTDIDKRFPNAEKIYEAIELWAKDMNVGDIVYLGERYGYAAVKVLNAEEIHKSPHFNQRLAVWKFDDPLWGDLAYPFALHLEETPGRIKWSMRPVGFDNEYVLREILGLSPEDVESLHEKGVVGKWNEGALHAGPPPGWDGVRGVTHPSDPVA